MFGQLEGGGHGQFAEIALLGLLDGDREIDTIARLDVIVKGALHLLFEGVKHLREELRIENLVDRERAFGGYLTLGQSYLGDRPPHSLRVIIRKPAPNLALQTGALLEVSLDFDALGNNRAIPRSRSSSQPATAI